MFSCGNRTMRRAVIPGPALAAQDSHACRRHHGLAARRRRQTPKERTQKQKDDTLARRLWRSDTFERFPAVPHLPGEAARLISPSQARFFRPRHKTRDDTAPFWRQSAPWRGRSLRATTEGRRRLKRGWETNSEGAFCSLKRTQIASSSRSRNQI